MIEPVLLDTLDYWRHMAVFWQSTDISGRIYQSQDIQDTEVESLL